MGRWTHTKAVCGASDFQVLPVQAPPLPPLLPPLPHTNAI